VVSRSRDVEVDMKGTKKILSSAVLLGLAMGLALLPLRADSDAPQSTTGTSAAQSGGNDAVPAYHAGAPRGALPATLSPEFFTDPTVRNAYSIAARIKKTLYQQPCYCHCDRSQGHTSLLDCFASKHGSGCGTCIYEDFYSYEQSRKGKTAAQIRAGIIRGEWQSVNATKYQKLPPSN
jgi:uncharacterized protein with PCYCGC motif